jgi:chloramphenicol 3-O phosphotransferase
MDRGNIVVLNGTSSAGKTSIARALQQIMEAPYLHTGTDHFLPRVPAKFFAVCDSGDAPPADYFLLVYQGGASRTVAEREGGEAVHADGVLAEVRIGPGGLKLLAGMYRGIAALSAGGIDVVVDSVIHDPRVLEAAVEALRGAPVLFVGLRLPLEVAEQRERERGDRGPGGAAAFFHRVHAHEIYDLELDTAAASPADCARQIQRALQEGHPRSAFGELAERFARGAGTG